MAVTAVTQGTKLATVGATPDLLANVAGPGTFTVRVSLRNMVKGDITYINIKIMPLTAGTAEYVYSQFFSGLPPAKAQSVISVPISTELTDSTAIVFEINQTKGTARNYDWTINKYA